ncbi:MAG: hypothetical protein ACTSYL_00315 [Candidatus Thorarchaeota archaeon]
MSVVIVRYRHRGRIRQNIHLFLIAGLLLTTMLFFVTSGMTEVLLPNYGSNTTIESQYSGVPPPIPFTLMLHDVPLGSLINATVQVGFFQMPDSGEYALGLETDYLKITKSPVYSSAYGLGYDEIRNYYYTKMLGDTADTVESFVYTPVNQLSADSPVWTPYSAFGLYSNHFSDSDLRQITHAGCAIEFVNLSIYYPNNPASLCGPNVIRLEVSYTKSTTGWTVDYIMSSSNEHGVEYHETLLVIQHQASNPISLLFIGLIGAWGIALGSTLLKTLHKKRMRRREGPEIALFLN